MADIELGPRGTRATKPKYDEPDSDADQYIEITNSFNGRKRRIRKRYDDAGNRIPRVKKAKKPKTAVKKKASKRSLAHIKTGALEGILKLPMDLITEILAQLSVFDLIVLSKVSRDLRELLLTKKTGSGIWQTSFDRLYALGLPKCPSELSLPRYAQILSIKDCTGCRKSIDYSEVNWISFGLGVRLCKACFKSQMVLPGSRKILEAEVAVDGDQSDDEVRQHSFNDLDPRLMPLATAFSVVPPRRRRWYNQNPREVNLYYLPEIEKLSTELTELEDGDELRHFTMRLAQSAARKIISEALDKKAAAWLRKVELGELTDQRSPYRFMMDSDDSEDESVAPKSFNGLSDLDFIRPPPATKKKKAAKVNYQTLLENRDTMVQFLKDLKDEQFSSEAINHLKWSGDMMSYRVPSADCNDAYCRKQVARLRRSLRARDAQLEKERREQRVRTRLVTLKEFYEARVEEAKRVYKFKTTPPFYDIMQLPDWRAFATSEERTDAEDEFLLTELEVGLPAAVADAQKNLAASFAAALRETGFGANLSDATILDSPAALWECNGCNEWFSYAAAIVHKCAPFSHSYYHRPNQQPYARTLTALPTVKGPASRTMIPIPRVARTNILVALEAAGIPTTTRVHEVNALGRCFFIVPSAKLAVSVAIDSDFQRILNSLHDFKSLVNAVRHDVFKFEHAVRKVAGKDDEEAIAMAACRLCTAMRPCSIKEATYHIGAVHGVLSKSASMERDLEPFKAIKSSLELSKEDKLIKAPDDYTTYNYRYRYTGAKKSIHIKKRLST